MDSVKDFLKGLKVHHYIVFAIVLAIGIFNAVTALSPQIKQKQRESNIEKVFDQWWETEGAKQFEAVGLKADEKTRSEEFEQFRERYLKENGTFVIEDRIEEMKKEFREWWEIKGGKDNFTKEKGYYPKERDFIREQNLWIKKYTDKNIRYRLAFVPEEAEYDRLLTSWILFPGILSFLLFAVFFCLAYYRLSDRWGVPPTVGMALGLILLGGLFVSGFTSTSFFDHYAVERYMGCSVALCFMLGAVAFPPSNDKVSALTKAAAIAGVALDVLVNWIVNGGIFGAIGAASLVAFGLGALAGSKIPRRLKTIQEHQADALAERLKKNATSNLLATRKAKNRALIGQGLDEANKAHYDSAQRILSQALNALLQEHPIDAPTVKKLADLMTSPSVFIEVPSAQWLEWGETAKSKTSLDSALVLLEKGLSLETNVTLARRALYNIGEIRVNRNWNLEEGIARLNKVLELGDGDILAVQARKMLAKAESLMPKETPEPEQESDSEQES